MISYGIAVHGGAGSPPQFTDGCKAACESAFILLGSGSSSLDAVVDAVRLLEDDGRFNAGSGSALRLDGKTIEMDASVMDSRGNIGIVIAIKNVRNPVRVARAVIDTPHIALAGEGATMFARKRRFEYFHNVSQHALERFKKMKQLIKENKLSQEAPLWEDHDIESLWNFDRVSYKEIFCDTVGAVALDKEGILAAATSTGGFSPMMMGRVGDSPMIGCGFYAGSACAIAVTGMGEEIIKKMLARTIYGMVSDGEVIKKACAKGLELFPLEIKAGVIGITKEGCAVVSNTQMSNYVMIKED